MMISTKTAASKRTGASLVELTFILPVVLVFILGAIDFAQIMYAYGTVSEAARAGARYAIVHGSMATTPVGPAANNATVQTIVQNNALALNLSRLTVTSTWGSASNQADNPITVTAAYSCPLSVGGLIGLGPITVRGSTTMLITH